MATTKPSRPKLIPLKDQAIAALHEAGVRMVTQTRAGSARRRLMNEKISRARAQYRAGEYAKATFTARTAHL